MITVNLSHRRPGQEHSDMRIAYRRMFGAKHTSYNVRFLKISDFYVQKIGDFFHGLGFLCSSLKGRKVRGKILNGLSIKWPQRYLYFKYLK